MVDEDARKLDWLLNHSQESICQKCQGKMEIIGSGKFRCKECGNEYMDDFGKVKEYIEEHGPSSIVEVADATGVKHRVIEDLLRKGRVEIPEGSPVFLHCEKCNCEIRYGRFCTECVNSLKHELKGVYVEVAGERPKKSGSKMHFLDRDRK